MISKAKLEIQNVCRTALELVCQGLDEDRMVVGLFVGSLEDALGDRGEDGQEMGLVVEGELVRHGAVEMDGERGNAADGLVEMDEAVVEGAVFVADNDAAAQREVAVEPGVPEASAVGGDAELQKALLLEPRDGLDLETRTVGVGADDVEALAHRKQIAHRKGHQSAVVASKEILAPGLDLAAPVVLLQKLLKALALRWEGFIAC